MLPEHAGRISAQNIEQPDQCKRRPGHLRVQSLVFEVAGHVHANKHHLKTTHKVAGHQQLKASIAEGFAQRLQNALLPLGRLTARKRGFAQTQRQRQHHQHADRQHQQGLVPAYVLNHVRRGRNQ